MLFILLLVAFFASIAGAICGIGGGVIIKPVLDLFQIAGVSTISFLSGCTVLSMSCYSVLKSVLAKESSIDFKTGTPLAIGAAVGGIVGKNLFQLIKDASPNPERVGGYQSICLAIITIAMLLYTIYRSKIKTYHIEHALVCITIGAFLGIMSSFLGIGGGPINLGVLFFFFSMDMKKAAQNSLYIILISQATSLLTTLITRTVPDFQLSWLLVMVCGGIAGGIAGRNINKKMDEAAVNKLFLVLMAVIIAISCYNTYHYFSA